jgi:hypothetical protein
MTNLQDRATYHAAQYALGGLKADLHRAASDFFTMAQVSVEKHDAKGAIYRYRQGLRYAAQAI